MSRKSLFGGTAPLALAGLILGVMALVVVMGGMSGFEKTLQDSIIDVTGQMRVVKRGSSPGAWQDLEKQIKEIEPSLVAATPYWFLEAVAANEGKLQGVILQGVDQKTSAKVLNLKKRLVEGSLQIGVQTDPMSPSVLVGKTFAQRLGLKIGDSFRVVVPIAEVLDPSSIKRKMGKFTVGGIMDLGKNDWNERFILADLEDTKKLAGVGEAPLGIIINFENPDKIHEINYRLSEKLGFGYWIQDWRDTHENLFQAVVIERAIVFLILLILVLVAAFNTASTMFVSVFQRFPDIAILKSLGLSRRGVLWVFGLQGMIMGTLGILGGIVLGLLLCKFLTWFLLTSSLLPGSVYKVDSIEFSLRWVDIFAVATASLLFCFIASLVPAKRGAALSTVEGLRYG